MVGGENCPVDRPLITFPKPLLNRLMPSLQLLRPVNALKAHLEENLGLRGRDGNIEEIDNLASGGHNLDRAIVGVEILDRAAHEDGAILDGELDGLALELSSELAANPLQVVV
jgi:hypothetical protein